MPYLKKTEPPGAKLRRLLLGHEIGANEIMSILKCCDKTARSRLKNPNTFTLEELHRICRFAHISADELREVILFP